MNLTRIHEVEPGSTPGLSQWVKDCCGCGVGWQLPSLGTAICHRCGPKKTGKKKKGKKEKEEAMFPKLNFEETI